MPYLALILATAIWGGALPIIKITTDYVPPITFLFLRLLLVAILCLPLIYVELKKTPTAKSDLKSLILLGIAGQTSLAFIFIGVKYTTSLDAAIIGTFAPLLIIWAGQYFFQEKLTQLTKIGILTATLGTAIIVLEPVLTQNHVQQHEINLRIFGNLMIVLYNLAFTMYILGSKIIMGQKSLKITNTLKHLHVQPLTRAYSPLLQTLFTFYVGFTTMIPLVFLENKGLFGPQLFDPTKLTTVPILGILYMALFSSIVAYIAFEWGLKKAHVNDTAIFGYLGPIFTLPFAYLILAEIPTQINLVGGAAIALGVIIAEKNKS